MFLVILFQDIFIVYFKLFLLSSNPVRHVFKSSWLDCICQSKKAGLRRRCVLNIFLYEIENGKVWNWSLASAFWQYIFGPFRHPVAFIVVKRPFRDDGRIHVPLNEIVFHTLLLNLNTLFIAVVWVSFKGVLLNISSTCLLLKYRQDHKFGDISSMDSFHLILQWHFYVFLYLKLRMIGSHTSELDLRLFWVSHQFEVVVRTWQATHHLRFSQTQRWFKLDVGVVARQIFFFLITTICCGVLVL